MSHPARKDTMRTLLQSAIRFLDHHEDVPVFGLTACTSAGRRDLQLQTDARTLRTFEPVHGPAKVEIIPNGRGTHLSLQVGAVTLTAVELGSPTSSASGS